MPNKMDFRRRWTRNPDVGTGELAIHIRTDNDINGNPRRGWMVFKDVDGGWEYVEWVEEGHSGIGSLRRAHPFVSILAAINVTPREYRSIRIEGSGRG